MTARRPRPRDRGLRLVAAIVLATATISLGPPSGIRPAHAASPSLSFVTAATYLVLPEEGRVAVTVRITATNHLRDTVTRRFYIEEGFLAVLPGTSNFALSGATGSPSVAVSSRSAAGVVLRLRFGARLDAGDSRDFTLTFDLPDPGGAPDRPVRISPSLVSFQAWAYGTDGTPGSSVAVQLPLDYEVALGRGPLTGPTSDIDGRQVFVSGPLAAPLGFAVDVTADRPGGFVEGTRSGTVAGRTVILRIRAWPDDPAWRSLVAEQLLRSLPVLADSIGTPWPIDGPLTVEESFSRGADGGAGASGAFDPARAFVEVSYLASPWIVFHAAAHGWFNGRLVADRWIAEGFASYYATTVAAALEIPVDAPDLAGVPPEAALPLNAWGAAGSTTDQDAYGAGASLALAREIEAAVGDEALQVVWRSAAEGVAAYQPAAGAVDPETGAGPPDWRGLLDLMEERATPAQAVALEGLWRRWVVRPDDAPLLDERAAARAAFRALEGAAAPWALPRSIRDALRAWRFDAAVRLMAQAGAVLDQRAALVAAAEGAGLTPPDAVRIAFEGDGGLALAGAEAAVLLEAIAMIRDAEAERVDLRGPVEWLGLVGSDPEAAIAAARSAFEAGDMDGAVVRAAEAETAWLAAPGLGRGRMISAALLVVAAVLVLLLVVQARRERPAGWSTGRGRGWRTGDRDGR